MIRILVYTLLSITSLTFASFFWLWGGSESEPFSIATGDDSGVYFRFGSQLANSLEQHQGETGPEIGLEVIETSGSQENLKLLISGEVDFAMVQNHRAGNIKVRSITGLYDETLHLVAHKGSNIRTLTDLIGKKVSIGESNSGTAIVTRALLEFTLNDLNQIEETQLPSEQALSLVESGELDAAFVMMGLRSSLLVDRLSQSSLHLVPLVVESDQAQDVQTASRELIEGFRTVFPYAQLANIPMYTYGQSPAASIPSLSTRAVLVCREDLSETVVREFTDYFFKSISELSTAVPALQDLNEQKAQSLLRYPLHRGAESYYHRRDPGFWVEYAELIGLLVSLTVLGWSGAVAIASYMKRNQKNHVDQYYDQVRKLDARLSQAGSPTEAAALIDQIRNVESQAVEELINEELVPDESFIILQQMILISLRRQQTFEPHPDATPYEH